MIDRKLSVAPMLDWTDKYCLYFLRQISSHTLFYTEMVTTGAILRGGKERFLDYYPEEHPLAIQLGGSDPDDLRRCSSLSEEWGYDEINLNVGCPSDRVQNGTFGACLMAEPGLVAECIAAMREGAPNTEVTVKHRIGIDDKDSYQELTNFVDKVNQAGCETFIVHARKAWLQGLSPKDNRNIPPLKYEVVHQLKRDFPHINFVINGGLSSLDEVERELQELQGAMIGREIYSNPWMLADADRRIYGDHNKQLTRLDVIEAMTAFIERESKNGVPVHRITRHMLGLFHEQPGGRKWRRFISENVHKSPSPQILHQALEYMSS